MRAGHASRSGVGVWNRRACDDPEPCTSSKVVPDTVGTNGDAMCSGVRIRCAPRLQSSTCHQGPMRECVPGVGLARARSPCAPTITEYIRSRRRRSQNDRGHARRHHRSNFCVLRRSSVDGMAVWRAVRTCAASRITTTIPRQRHHDTTEIVCRPGAARIKNQDHVDHGFHGSHG